MQRKGLNMARESEEDLLHREIDWARSALSDAVAAMKRHSVEAADPKLRAQTHPRLAVGAAATAGFAAARLVRPKSDVQFVADYLRKMQRELNQDDAGDRPPQQSSGGGLLGTIVSLARMAAVQLPVIYGQFKAAEAAEHAAAASENAADSEAQPSEEILSGSHS